MRRKGRTQTFREMQKKIGLYLEPFFDLVRGNRKHWGTPFCMEVHCINNHLLRMNWGSSMSPWGETFSLQFKFSLPQAVSSIDYKYILSHNSPPQQNLLEISRDNIGGSWILKTGLKKLLWTGLIYTVLQILTILSVNYAPHSAGSALKGSKWKTRSTEDS